MGLAETAELLVRMKMQDDTSGTAKKVTGSLGLLGKAAAGVATLGFGAMTKGAMEAEEAQGEFMAATGASREEAKQFVSQMDALAGTAGAVGVSFDEITATGTAVAQQFGLTGDAGRALTEDILEYAKVTGADASDAALQLEDSLAAMGLGAESAAGLMDMLVASSQTYGTSAGPDSLAVLQDIGPALQAMGMELGDGVELLNAFEVAGVDAGTASGALKKAIGELEPGQNLDALIARIGAIEDPLERAQAATEVFGKKAGPQMAALIKPGMTSLNDFGISAEEAAGATGKAAEDMLTTSDKIRGFLDKLGAGARELGQQFGPAVTAMGTIGAAASPFISKIGDMAGALKDKLTPALVRWRPHGAR
jgi:phage-related minor tail protein